MGRISKTAWDAGVRVAPPGRDDDKPVAPLPPPKGKAKELADKDADAWRAWDTARVTADGDRVLADRVYQAALNQKRLDHGKKHKHSQHGDAGIADDLVPGDEQES